MQVVMILKKESPATPRPLPASHLAEVKLRAVILVQPIVVGQHGRKVPLDVGPSRHHLAIPLQVRARLSDQALPGDDIFDHLDLVLQRLLALQQIEYRILRYHAYSFGCRDGVSAVWEYLARLYRHGRAGKARRELCGPWLDRQKFPLSDTLARNDGVP